MTSTLSDISPPTDTTTVLSTNTVTATPYVPETVFIRPPNPILGLSLALRKGGPPPRSPTVDPVGKERTPREVIQDIAKEISKVCQATLSSHERSVVITDIKDKIDLGSLTQVWHWVNPHMMLDKGEIGGLAAIVEDIGTTRNKLDALYKKTIIPSGVGVSKEVAAGADVIITSDQAEEAKVLYDQLVKLREALEAKKAELIKTKPPPVSRREVLVLDEEGTPEWLPVIIDAYVSVYGRGKEPVTVSELIRGIHRAALEETLSEVKAVRLQAIMHQYFGDNTEDIIFYMTNYLKKNRKFVSPDILTVIKF